VLAVSYLLGISLLLLALAAPAMADDTATLDRIKKKAAVTFGYREASPPFSFLAGDGQPAGYSVDLCKKIAIVLKSALGLADLKVSWVPVTPGDRIGKLQRGAIDLECGSTTVTFERLQQVAFSHMTFVDGGSVLATASSGIRGVKDLTGKRVGVIPNTTTDKALGTAIAALSVKPEIIHVTETREGLQALEAGRLDAYASDHLVLASLLSAARNPATLKLSEDYFSYEPYALMLRRADPSFQVQVNRTLSALYRSGAVVEIYERWFGSFNEVSTLMRSLYILHSWPDS
jgi:ABC-type amino acid transport substrate-binding protein